MVTVYHCLIFLFCKQKTAYEMRISDWSSDVCSSDLPRFAALFGPDALAEAPVTAVIGDGLVVAGTIDRLLVTDDAVDLIDFKTGRRVPATIDDVPTYHLRQDRKRVV